MSKVVIVDDDRTYLSLLGRAIKLEGLQDVVFLASNAAEFRHLASSPDLGLALLDVNLGEDETGFDLLLWLQGRGFRGSAYLQSWTVEERERRRALDLGSQLNLKVNSFAALRENLRRWVEEAGGAAAKKSE